MSNTKKSIRPNIPSIGSQENASPEERFQNETLRPIIKMQHKLIIAFFRNYLVKTKIEFDQLSEFKQKELISKTFSKDLQFKTELRGMIIGQLNVEEYHLYLGMAATLNKRIGNMLQERLISTI